ncbi:hypothetical protein BKI52_11670 [marine bacterium AO1-C]|nr:hypothetical protein BKI52_11670 [marine bacterium AO1-C]
MNKQTKILFIIYLIVAPVVYFVSSAHTPNKQVHKFENFAQKFIQEQEPTHTVIAFINSQTKTKEYQASLSDKLKNKGIDLVVFTIPSAQDSFKQLPCTNEGLRVYAGKQYFSKAGVKVAKQHPSLQLFLVDQQMKLRYQERHFDSSPLDLTKLVSQINQIKS